MAQLKIEQPFKNHADHSQLKDVVYMAKGGTGFTQGLPDQTGGLFFTAYQDPNTNHTSQSETKAIGVQYYLNVDGIIWARTGFNLGYQGGAPGGQYRTSWQEWKQITLKGINDIQIENKLSHMQDEINELQSKQFDDVYQHHNQELTGNIDSYNKLGSQKFHNITSSPAIPNNHGSGYGTIFYIPEHKDGSGHKGFQLLNSTTHQCLYYRTSNQDGDWQEWYRIATGKESILKPEAQSKYVGDLNDIKTTSIFRVGGEQGNRPIGSSEGVIQTLKGEGNRCSQVWYGVSGPGASKIYSRAFRDNGVWTDWKEISKNIDINFNHYIDRTPTNIHEIVKSGYYHTTPSNNGFPKEVESDEESKNGILLVIIKDTKTHFEYTPIKGKYKNHMFIGDYERTIRVGEPINWTRVASSEGHIKVHDTRTHKGATPQEYYDHTNQHFGGYIVYEWKWASDINLDQYIKGQNDDILLMTITPVSKENQVYEEVINQKAFDLKTHKTYFRNSKKQADSFNHWSEWSTESSIQLPTITVNTNVDLKNALVGMFGKWAEHYKNYK